MTPELKAQFLSELKPLFDKKIVELRGLFDDQTADFTRNLDEYKVRMLEDIQAKFGSLNIPFTSLNLDLIPQDILKLFNIKIINSVIQGANAQTAGNYKQFFVCERAYQIIAYTMVHTVAATNGSPVTLQLEKLPSGTAPAAGVTCLATALSLKATINTPQYGVLTNTKANLLLVKGDSLAHLVSGTLTTLENVAVSVILFEQ